MLLLKCARLGFRIARLELGLCDTLVICGRSAVTAKQSSHITRGGGMGGAKRTISITLCMPPVSTRRAVGLPELSWCSWCRWRSARPSVYTVKRREPSPLARFLKRYQLVQNGFVLFYTGKKEDFRLSSEQPKYICKAGPRRWSSSPNWKLELAKLRLQLNSESFDVACLHFRTCRTKKTPVPFSKP